MLTLGLRVTLIVSAALALAILAALGGFYLQREDRDRAAQLPFPGQVAAIVDLVEATPPQRLDGVLRALNSRMLHVIVHDAMPPPRAAPELPGSGIVLRRYLHALGARPVQAELLPAPAGPPPGAGPVAGPGPGPGPGPGARPGPGQVLRISVGLADGRAVTVEAAGPLLRGLFGLRLALVLLAVTLVIGVLLLWALLRQIRPVRELALAVDRFGERLDLPEMPPQGAAEVRRLIAAVNRMQARLRALVETRTRMLAAVGHDFGTYLTRLRLRAEFIDDERQRAAAERDIGEMHALISDTLALARAERGALPRQRLDLCALLRRAADAAPDARAVRLELPAAPLQVAGDATALTRVFVNLIGNALKYGHAATVSLCGDDAQATVLVDDDGPGIPEAERAAVLEPFYRRDVARNLDAPGSGLGLAIAHDLVQRHGGTLRLEDAPGGGLRVRVNLPLHRGEQDGA